MESCNRKEIILLKKVPDALASGAFLSGAKNLLYDSIKDSRNIKLSATKTGTDNKNEIPASKVHVLATKRKFPLQTSSAERFLEY
ncbi:hypothetical protein [Bacillus sp. CECT 9360]|uniref:hypothetical protein n=1 Tax=Bacillus sp. CECT 9360 TaxID=2845821 RepID=UPI001E5E6454|nr:hypothetical protein [Bacillus sp. CECT 9360]CAH0345786.1 hypothetical protein BCI9360_02084 [Bacillus sp. CECT 9360]